jgi:catechol 2,3-dioxygenase-like lactoylglutathione lyase family enzyme
VRPRITVITLGVDDLERAVRFYRDGLGLKTEGIIGREFEHGAVAFFDLEGGVKLALWPRSSLAHDSKLWAGESSPTDFSIGHNVASKAEVAGYFQDPDQHLWEVAWNPAWQAEIR